MPALIVYPRLASSEVADRPPGTILIRCHRASLVALALPADVVSTLIRTGSLVASDFIGERKYVLADGSVVPSATFNIRSLKVGNRVLQNVLGSVASAKGSLLRGQSFLSRFSSWSIDNKRQILILN